MSKSLEARRLIDQAARRLNDGRFDQALALADRALAMAPALPPAQALRGAALFRLGRAEEALAALQRATAADPGDSQSWMLQGVLHAAAARVPQAMQANAAALDADAGNLTAAMNMGLLLMREGPAEGAVEAFRHVTARDPNHAQAWHFEGMTLVRLGALPDAVVALERAVALEPGNADSLLGLGFALSGVERWDEAIAAFDRCLAIDPGREEARSLRFQARRYLCDWDGHAAEAQAIADDIALGGRSAPFPLLATHDDPLLQRLAATRHLEGIGAPALLPGLPQAHPPGERLRIAYVSADFYNHATMYLMAAAFEAHDRDRFEVTCVNIGRELPDDAWQARLRASIDHWLPAAAADDIAIAEELRRRRIDIAVDLKGYTRFARPGVFTARAAPVQVSYLGHPGTLGMAAMDYIIADRHLIDASNRDGFSEAVVTLPGSYQPNEPARVREATPDRASLGLPDGAMVYASFNQISKLTPDVFAAWLEILGQVPGSVLWIWVQHPAARARLRTRAAAAGIDPDRLVFAGTVPIAAHLGRLPCANLFLDTLPYNAHTTASDALGSGVPVLTRTGQSFAGRVATSLVHNVGLPELAVADVAAYVDLAVALGRDASRRTAVRARLAANLPTAPLFDVTAHTRALEAAFMAMDARQRRGEAPADFAV